MSSRNKCTKTNLNMHTYEMISTLANIQQYKEDGEVKIWGSYREYPSDDTELGPKESE